MAASQPHLTVVTDVFSVRDFINAINKENGSATNVEEIPRRAGDPPELISVADKIRSNISWQPQYDDLNLIVKTSLAWEKKLLAL